LRAPYGGGSPGETKDEKETEMLTGIFARLFGFLCVFALGGMASHAGADDITSCRDVITMDGYLFRAAELCNEKWVNRLSLLDNIVRLRQCLNLYVIDEKRYNCIHTMKTPTCQMAASSKDAFYWMPPLLKRKVMIIEFR
jgi:hypothetical protein